MRLPTELRHRMRPAVPCMVLVAAAFSIAPGKIISDTKLDMAVNPGGFLARALRLWTQNEHFGQLQNQAYGYLFPMGPFYLLGRAAGIAPWVTQRLWISLVLCAAFLGMVQLAKALGVGTPNGRIIAGFAYAVAPRAQELIAVNSSEFLPTAVLPWILLPLVKGARQGSPRRAAALSAIAVVCCGGINGVAVLAVLVVPLLYLLTRRRGPRKWRLLGWWLGCTALAAFWWIVPLFIMSRYVFRFIDYVESAGTTTQTTSITNIMRGAANWVGYVPVNGFPWWPAGFELSTAPWLIVLTGVVAGLGLIGLCRRGLPERAFLLSTLLLGVAIIVMGHQSVIAPPFADGLRELFDTWLAPFRNIHKFDALVRLPLALGLAFLLVSPAPKLRPALTLVTLGALGGTFLPVLNAGLAAPGSFARIPRYWQEAGDWINRNAGEHTVLAVPGARFGEYLWGRPIDEPMQPLLKARWASRMIVPNGSAGLARLMEAIDERFASGYGSAGLAKVLSRMGVRFLLVRNDMDRIAARGAWPARVHETLQETPGVRRVAEFGAFTGAPFNADAMTSFDQPYKALEIYEVQGAQGLVSTVPKQRPLRVTGGPEALLTLADQGLLDDDRPVLFNDDGDAPDIPVADTVITDTLRRREVNFSDLRKGSSPTLTESDRYQGSSRVKDLVEPGWDSYTSLARLFGVKEVTASSSASDITALPENRSAGQQPFAAIDGDQRTSWSSAGWYGAVDEWLMVRFLEPVKLDQIDVSFVVNYLLGPPVREVSIETEAGRIAVPVKATGAPQRLLTPTGPSSWLRIRVTKLAYQPRQQLGSRAGIAEVSVPGLLAGRAIVTPKQATIGTGPEVPSVALTGLTGSAAPCMLGSRSWVCSPLLGVQGEDGNAFDRVFTSPAPAQQEIRGSAVLTDLKTIEAYSDFGPPRATASSSLVEHPAVRGRSAFDGDRATTWISSPFDAQPTLTVEFGKSVRLSRLTFIFPNEITQPPATQVAIVGAKDLRQGWLDRRGVFNFAAIRTDRLIIKFQQGGSPVQITDIEIPGVKALGPAPGLRLNTQCGTGPAFSLLESGYKVPTRLVGGTLTDLAQGRPVPFASCGGPIPVPAGEHRLHVASGDPFRIASALVRPVGARRAPSVSTEPVEVNRWTPESRSVSVRTTGESYLVVNDNYNPGWTATLDGRELRSSRLDGWRQAWVLPPNSEGAVAMSFAPDRWYRLALLIGFMLALGLILLAVFPVRATGQPPAVGPMRVTGRRPWLIALGLGFWAGGIIGVIGVAGALAIFIRLRIAQQDSTSPRLVRVATAVTSPLVSGGLMALAAALAALGTLFAGQEYYGVAEPLRDLVPQLLCLPLLGRLVWALREPAPAVALPPGPDAGHR